MNGFISRDRANQIRDEYLADGIPVGPIVRRAKGDQIALDFKFYDDHRKDWASDWFYPLHEGDRHLFVLMASELKHYVARLGLFSFREAESRGLTFLKRPA